MKLTLLAATLAVLTVTACGKPNQALPEQEKENFAKISSQSAAPAEPDSAAEAGTGDSIDNSASPTKSEIEAAVDSTNDTVDETVDAAKEKIAATVDSAQSAASDAKDAAAAKTEEAANAVADTASDAKKGVSDALK